MVGLLLGKGGDVHAVDKYKKTAKDARENKEVSQPLVDKTDAVMVLLEAAKAEVELPMMHKRTDEKAGGGSSNVSRKRKRTLPMQSSH